ncbi:hypothetical protein HOK51_06280 [Candidatus Woesearchaeota archaeon]|jgi:hypothetical protein|nr:hypothetical protein [Candidatus Woesearchaeota archaeon]MBT6519433.1 hypothetical protein [Candidatus Woesearchaeota archaeon]MBT7368906.1 hypothetical protein [Candidatus Woesearchaeota archaeon]
MNLKNNNTQRKLDFYGIDFVSAQSFFGANIISKQKKSSILFLDASHTDIIPQKLNNSKQDSSLISSHEISDELSASFTKQIIFAAKRNDMLIVPLKNPHYPTPNQLKRPHRINQSFFEGIIDVMNYEYKSKIISKISSLFTQNCTIFVPPSFIEIVSLEYPGNIDECESNQTKINNQQYLEEHTSITNFNPHMPDEQLLTSIYYFIKKVEMPQSTILDPTSCLQSYEEIFYDLGYDIDWNSDNNFPNLLKKIYSNPAAYGSLKDAHKPDVSNIMPVKRKQRKKLRKIINTLQDFNEFATENYVDRFEDEYITSTRIKKIAPEYNQIELNQIIN